MPSGNPGRPRPNRRGKQHKVHRPYTRKLRAHEAPDTARQIGSRVASQGARLNALEREVCELIAKGHSDRDIAQILTMHPAAVVKIDVVIRRKLGAVSREDVGGLLERERPNVQ